MVAVENDKQMTLVAIGANLAGPWGDPRQACEHAADSLASLPGMRLAARSRWFRSAPVPRSDQPDYVNGVVRLAGAVEPGCLLALLHAIERQGGRRRSMPNAPRTLDLDIIDMNGLWRASPDPILPHPRAHLRAFVLLPLQDVAPGWVHPASGLAVADLLSRLRDGCGAAEEPLDWPIPYS